MKLHKNFGASVLLLMLFFISQGAFAQLQPYQDSATAKYVKTTRFDTVSVPYVTGSKTKGVITNESALIDLKVWFAKKDSSVRDAKTYFVIKPGRSLKFGFYGKKIFRCTSSDSAWSQVMYGDDMELLGSKTTDLSDYITASQLSTELADYVLTTVLADYATLDSLTGYANLVQDETIVGEWTFSVPPVLSDGSAPSITPAVTLQNYYGTSGEVYLSEPIKWLLIKSSSGSTYLIPVY